MADTPNRDAPPGDPGESQADPGAPEPATPHGAPDDRSGSERVDRGIADFVRRAVSAGVGAASRSKDDFVRVAATEMRSWLEHMNLSEEVAKALANMVIEVKTEIRFRPSPEGGRLVPQASSDMKVKTSDS